MSGGPARFFDAIAGRYERAYALDPRSSRERMARVLELLPPRARVLDLGVGSGRELGALQDAGHEPTGLDASRAMLDRCARRARPVPLVHADFYEPLPFADASFDAVLALHGTLAHAPSDGALAALAREVARVLREDGVLVVEAPTPATLDRLAAAPAEDRRVRRTGPRAWLYEDLVTGASIEARPPDASGWRALLEPAFETRIETIGADELLVIARRRAPHGEPRA